jgi:hypothetical protein
MIWKKLKDLQSVQEVRHMIGLDLASRSARTEISEAAQQVVGGRTDVKARANS